MESYISLTSIPVTKDNVKESIQKVLSALGKIWFSEIEESEK